MRPVVSGSELDTYLTCRMKHTYAYGLNLEPRRKSRALQLGTAGHELLAEYYRALESGADQRLAIQQAEATTNWVWVTSDVDPDVTDFALQLVRAYWAAYPPERADVVAVEQTFRVEYSGYTFAFTPDLLLRSAQGGLEVHDHRFLGRFYEPEIVVLDQQLPRYVLGLHQLGYDPQRAVRNMILTSKTAMRPSKRVMRAEAPLTAARLTSVQVDRDRVAHELLAWRARPVEERVLTSTRINNALVCRFCPFLKPCSLRAEGLDDSVILEQDFQPSTYGYAAESE